MRTFLHCLALLLFLTATEAARAQTANPTVPRGQPTAPEMPGTRGGDTGPAPTIPDLFDRGSDDAADRRGPRIDGAEAVPNEICVIFPPSTPDDVANAFAGDLELEVARNFTMQGLGLKVYLMRLGDGAEPDQVFEDAGNDRRPLWVQQNFIYRTSQNTSGGETVLGSQQYALQQIRAGKASRKVEGQGIRLALIDSGVDVAHESLKGADIETVNAVEEGKPVPSETHGTVLASILVGQGPLNGIAPRIQLIAIRAFHEIEPKSGGAESSSYTLAWALELAIRAQVRVVNLSLTGPQDKLVAQMVNEAMMRRIGVVAAAGNAGPEGPAAYPAAQDGVIAVTATDIQDRLYAQANRGGYISVAAPGVDILGARPGGGYDFFSGTSMATGYASGLAALLISAQADLSVVKLRQTMEKSAVDLGPPQRDTAFGAGRIDAASALALLP